jgi:type I restriction enzyme, S subunit
MARVQEHFKQNSQNDLAINNQIIQTKMLPEIPENNDQPKGRWPIKRLGDLCELITKGTTPTSVGFEFVNDGINFIKVESITENGQFVQSKLAKISKECHNTLRRSQLKVGDILFSIAGALGRTAYVTENLIPANTNQALAIIRLKKSDTILTEFVLMALSTGVVLEQIEKFKGGVAQLNLSLAQVQEFSIQIPPLLEQKRIVRLLNEAFDGIATARAHAERNLQNARALFDSYIQELLNQDGSGWAKPIADCFKVKSGDFLPAKTMVVSGSYDVYGGNGINGKHNQINLSGENILIGRVGERCGNVRRVVGNIWVTDNAFYISQFFHTFDLRFLTRVLELKKLRKTANQAAQPVISFTTIKTVMIEFPKSIDEQKSIADRIDQFENRIQRLESIYQRKINNLETLKKSILHQAFSGML